MRSFIKSQLIITDKNTSAMINYSLGLFDLFTNYTDYTILSKTNIAESTLCELPQNGPFHQPLTFQDIKK